ncbi:transporter substrate-binding domain-containing protein [Advenella sp. FME57]|uniref:transporter substrate-binding domain-containing protein n=3 Tax=unclassified Advenella TaxID=2685285 RepID=UPI001D01CB12|nr:transporter substrate-binding domain-containing protein [Advenella sp. FME57]
MKKHGAFESGCLGWVTRTLGIAALALVIGLFPGLARAQDQGAASKPVTVGVYESPPFVLRENGQYAGMAIELWQSLEDKLQLSSTYRSYPSYRKLIEAVGKGEIDAAVTNLTITRQRAQSIAFTQPWYDSGLRIMTPSTGAGSFQDIIDGLSDSGHLTTFAWLLIITLFATVIITLLDRRLDREFPRRWREGLADNFFHTMSIMTTGKTTHKNLFGWIGRIWSALWMVLGVAIIAYVTSSITSVMTTTSLTSQIHSLSDLSGKTVGVLGGSVGEDYVQNLGIRTQNYDTLDASIEGLISGEVDALVGDAPVLEYFAHSQPGQPVRLIGAVFHPDKYGFGFPLQSELLRPVTLELLGLHERGDIHKLRMKYFGNTR